MSHLNPEELNALYKQLVVDKAKFVIDDENEGEANKDTLEKINDDFVVDLEKRRILKMSFLTAGQKLIKAGKVAVVILAGG